MNLSMLALAASVMGAGAVFQQIPSPAQNIGGKPGKGREATTSANAKKSTPTEPLAPALQVPEVNNIYDVCRLREAQIASLNKSILALSIEVINLKDGADRRNKIDLILSKKKSLVDAEESWNRMSCSSYIVRFSSPPRTSGR